MFLLSNFLMLCVRVCVFVRVRRLTSLLDKGGAVQNFVDSLQQLTNPEMLFKVIWFMVYDMVRLVSQQHIRVSGSASLVGRFEFALRLGCQIVGPWRRGYVHSMPILLVSTPGTDWCAPAPGPGLPAVRVR